MHTLLSIAISAARPPLLAGTHGKKRIREDDEDEEREENRKAGYAQPWCRRGVLVPAMRHKGIKRLRLSPKYIAMSLPGPDASNNLGQLARLADANGAQEVMRLVGYRGPPELFSCYLCLDYRRSTAAYVQRRLGATEKPVSSTSSSLSLASSRHNAGPSYSVSCTLRDFAASAWRRKCRCGEAGLMRSSKTLAEAGGTRKCGYHGAYQRPVAGTPLKPERFKKQATVDAFIQNRSAGDVGCALTCGKCGHLTLHYTKGSDHSFPRFCCVCQCKRRPGHNKWIPYLKE
jgi:hypothetical protein